MEEQITTPTESGESEQISQLRNQLTTAEANFAQIQQEKIQMEVDFEYKRSKIKELYYAKDHTIREQNSKIFEAGKRISALESRVKELNEETENIKMIASVSENTKQEAVEDLNKHHQEEIESLRCVLQDSMEEQRRELVLQFEEERRRWEDEKRKWEEGEKEREKGKLMEHSMLQAQNEAEKLKSVVLPLEKEITQLKQQLENSSQQFQQLNQQFETIKSEKLEEMKENEDIASNHNEEKTQLEELTACLQSEKSSRKDLEVYAESLNNQRGVLLKENEVLKTEMHEVCRMLEHEQSDHNVLKQTWKQANEQFIVAQKFLGSNLKLVRSVLTANQVKKVTMLEKKLQNEKDAFVVISSNANSKPEQQTLTHDDNSFGSFQTHNPPHSDSLSLNSVRSPSTESHDTVSVTSVNSMPGNLAVVEVGMPPNRVLSAPNLQLISNENERKPSKAWDEMTDETISPDPSIDSTLINVDHKNFSDINKDLNSQITEFKKEIEKLKGQLGSEVKQRLKVEESVMHAAEDCQQRISELCLKVIKLETLTSDEKRWREDKEAEDNGRIETLLIEHEKVTNKYTSLKKEHETISKYKQEFKESELPKTPEGMRVGLMRYREALIIAKAQKDQVESKLQSQLNFLKDRFDAELTAKEQIEESLSGELDEARGRLEELRRTQRRLEEEAAGKSELQEQMEKDHLSLTSIRSKSKEIINGLKEKLLLETKSKEGLEKKLSVCKNQLRSLQESLETSEQVQRDFVRLSQSLQMKLEDIRQKEEEKQESKMKEEVSNHNQTPSTSNSV